MNEIEARAEKTIRFTQALSLFVILIGLFLGSMYAFNGNLFISIPLSAILVLGLNYFVRQMISAKMERKTTGFSFSINLLWSLFVASSIPISLLVLHTFNVEVLEHEDIRSVGLKKIAFLKTLKEDYTKKYDAFLDSRGSELETQMGLYKDGFVTANDLINNLKVNQSFINGCDGVDVNECVDKYLEIERIKFLREDTTIFGSTAKYAEEKTTIIENWDRFKINQCLMEIDENISLTHSKLDSYLRQNANNIGLMPLPPQVIESSLIDNPISLLQKHLGILDLIIMLLIYGFLLLPYLMAPAKLKANDKTFLGFVIRGSSKSSKPTKPRMGADVIEVE